MRRQEIPELHHSQEFMEEVDTAIVRETSMITGDFDISRRIWHSSNS
jgi:hypothetical protein